VQVNQKISADRIPKGMFGGPMRAYIPKATPPPAPGRRPSGPDIGD
jgi:hypothetical protein